MPDDVIWQPTAKQAEFLRSSALECLYGGAMGSGKSDALLAAAISQVENPQHRGLLLRRSFPMTRDLVSRSFALYKPLGGEFKAAEKTWVFPSGSTVEINYCDQPQDRWQFQDRSFSFIGWDELGQWPTDGTDGSGEPVNVSYLFLLSRLRAIEGANLRLECRATTNPGGVGGGWIQRRFGIPDSGESSERIDPQTGHRRQFVAARLVDNPFLNNTSYARQLMTLSEADRKSLLLGRWDAFEGSVFSEFSHEHHVVAPFQIPHSWTECWRACDDGFRAPACVLWAVREPIYDTIFIVHELYEAGLTPEELGRAVCEIDRFFAPRCISGVIDSASFADHTGTGGRATVMNRMYGTRWEPVEKNAASRLAGKAAIHSRLAIRTDTGEPGMKIFKTCQHLAHDLPRLTYASAGEDVDSDVSFDHSYDCLRYLLNRKSRRAYIVEIGGI